VPLVETIISQSIYTGIDNVSGVEMASYKYEYAASIIRDKIFDGTYKPGNKIPSIQELTSKLSLNSDTIIRAYRLLESEHMIYPVAKSGYYVVKSTLAEGEKPRLIDMVSTSPEYKITPYEDYCHCMTQAISLYEHKLFSYSQSQGMPELISVLSKH